MHLKTKFLTSHCAREGYFKDWSAEKLGIFHCGKAVAFPNEKYNNKMEILAIPIMNPLAGFMIIRLLIN